MTEFLKDIFDKNKTYLFSRYLHLLNYKFWMLK